MRIIVIYCFYPVLGFINIFVRLNSVNIKQGSILLLTIKRFHFVINNIIDGLHYALFCFYALLRINNNIIPTIIIIRIFSG